MGSGIDQPKSVDSAPSTTSSVVEANDQLERCHRLVTSIEGCLFGGDSSGPEGPSPEPPPGIELAAFRASTSSGALASRLESVFNRL